ncbi:MAG: NUDIX hydrolase [Dehalococcoidia bacterium]
MRVEENFSAGGVVYRRDDDDFEVALCGRNHPQTWSLPKGTPDPGESPEQTALREVQEETGLKARLKSDLGEIEYWFMKPGARVHKRVQFFLMEAVGGSMDNHDPEFDQVSWFPGNDALRSLTYTNEVEVVGRALQRLRDRGR